MHARAITLGVTASIVGFLAFVFIRAVSGRTREVHGLMWVVAAMFVLYFVQGPLIELIA